MKRSIIVLGCVLLAGPALAQSVGEKTGVVGGRDGGSARACTTATKLSSRRVKIETQTDV